MRGKERTTVLAVGSMVLIAVGFGLWLSWGFILEEWRLFTLLRASPGERPEILKRLVPVASARSIPPLLDLLKDCGGSVDPVPGYGEGADGIIDAILIILGRDCGAAARRLAGLIGHPDPVVRVLVAGCLGEVGFDSSTSIAALERLLSDGDPLVVTGALWALGSCGERAYPVLIAAFASGDPLVRQTAVLALGRRSIHSEQVKMALQALAGDPDRRVRNGVWYVLESPKEAPREPDGAVQLAAESLVKELCASKSWNDRVQARWKLMTCGPNAVPALLAGLAIQDPLVRREVVEALGAIGDASAVPAIERAIGDVDGVVRKRAQRALLGLRCPAR